MMAYSYKKHKETARKYITEKVVWFNNFYRFDFGKIAIRNQKTRWGSCSRRRNLNFNFRLLFVPEKFVDYVVVHEICHLKELNHSKAFWSLVSQAIPNYNIIRKELRKYKVL